MRKTLVPALLTTAALLLAFGADADAQARTWSDPTGFHAALNFNGAAMVFDDSDDAESGTGGGLVLGWGFNNLLTLYLEMAGAELDLLDGSDTYSLVHADLGVRFNILDAGKRWRPYALVGFGARGAGLDIGGDLFTITGTSLNFGGGIAYFFSRKVSADVGIKWNVGTFTEAEYRGNTVTIDEGAVSSRFSLGVNYWHGYR